MDEPKYPAPEPFRGWEDWETAPKEHCRMILVGRWAKPMEEHVSRTPNDGFWAYIATAMWVKDKNSDNVGNWVFYETPAGTAYLFTSQRHLRKPPTHWRPLDTPDGSDYTAFYGRMRIRE